MLGDHSSRGKTFQRNELSKQDIWPAVAWPQKRICAGSWEILRTSDTLVMCYLSLICGRYLMRSFHRNCCMLRHVKGESRISDRGTVPFSISYLKFLLCTYEALLEHCNGIYFTNSYRDSFARWIIDNFIYIYVYIFLKWWAECIPIYYSESNTRYQYCDTWMEFMKSFLKDLDYIETYEGTPIDVSSNYLWDGDNTVVWKYKMRRY